MARRVRRLFRGGRIVDLGGGHGLLAQALLILDDTSPCALVADKALPPSAAKLHEVLVQAWRRLEGRVEFVPNRARRGGALRHGPRRVGRRVRQPDGRRARHAPCSARARVAVLPCCHHLKTGDTGGLSGWVDRAAAIDIMRAVRLGGRGYRIWTQTIPDGHHAEEPAAPRRAGGAARRGETRRALPEALAGATNAPARTRLSPRRASAHNALVGGSVSHA